ncbi:S8 family serine peptidase [Catonella morbi]|nr:S8 family serine peptidase [Catonella morbi]
MKNRKIAKSLSLLLVLFMVISIFPMNLFAKTDSSYMDKIENTLKAVSASKEVEFIVTLKAEADLSRVNPEDVADTLKDTSEKSQEKLISFIERKVKEGEITEYNSFFIINSIYIKGKAELIDKIARRSDVYSIRSNHTIVSDKEEKVKLKNRLLEASDHIPWNIESIQADRVTKTGKDIVVGIIDSGVNPNHPELQGAMLDNGFKDFVEASNTEPKDSTGHGTHVAGTILGRTIGIAREAKFIVARVFNESGEASDEGLLAAGQWILEKRPQVVNNSWGGNKGDNFYEDIVKKWKAAGIVPVFSAGNTGAFNAGGEGSIGSPASLPDSFSVGALTKEDKIAKFSLRGPSKLTGNIKPEISAPGVNILSADFKGGYVLKTGTSMAAPHVTGAVALMLDANKSLSVDKVEEILKTTATPLTDDNYISSPNMGYGYGKLNVFKAVEAALGKDVNSFATFTGRTLVSGTDNELPVIEATTPKKLYNAYDFELEAKVSDNVGVKSVTLYYKNSDSEPFKTKELELYTGNKKNGTYSVTLHPADLPVGNTNYYIEAVDYSGNKYQTDTISATVESGIKLGYTNDFENGADGFVFGGKTPMWEVGTPTVGPAKAASGTKLVGTRLNGNYNGLIDSLLISPPIDLSSETRDAVLRFKDWSELDNYMGGFEDSAEVWIGEIDSTDSSINKIKYGKTPVLINKYSKREWKEHYIDLSPYKNKKIVVMFALRWAGYSERAAAGYYIDDFKIEALSNDVPLPPSEGLSAENFAGTGKVRIKFNKVSNPEVTKYALYRSGTKDGEYKKIKEDVAKYSFIEDIPLPQEGSYYYKIASVKGDMESALSKPMSVTYTIGKEVKKFNFENGEQGWTSTSDGKWERGVIDYDNYSDGPSSYSMKTKNPDSPNVFMTGLNKARTVNKTYELISPVIDLSNMKKANIYYQNWYNFTSETQDIHEIWFKKDNDDWERVFNLNNNIDINNINGHKRAKNTWVLDGMAIEPKFLTNSFQMKFKLSASNDYSEPGWYIDDVAVYDTSNVNESASSPETLATTEDNSTYALNGEEVLTNKTEELTTLPDLSDGKFTLLGTAVYKTNETAPAKFAIPVSAIVKILETNTYVRSETGSGKFEIKHPAGTYTAVAYNEKYKSKPFNITLKEGEKLEQDIVMPSLETFGLSFDIKDTSGNSVNSDVKIYEKGSNVPKYISSSKSTVILANIPEGEYKIIVMAAGYRTKEQMVSITGNTTLPTIVLTKLTTDGKREELSNDNGDFAKAKAVLSLKEGGSLAVKYHFDKEQILKKVRFGLMRAGQESIVGKSFIYSIYGENTKDGYPGDILLGPVTTTVTADNNFTDINIPDLFVKGDIYVAYTQVGSGNNVPRMAVDESTKGEGKTFKLINGAWNEASELGMYMVRIEAEKVSSVAPSKPPVKPSTPSDNPGYSYVPSSDVKEEKGKKEDGKKEDKKETEKVTNKVQEIEEKIEKQIAFLEKKIKALEKIEKKFKTSGQRDKKNNNISTILKKKADSIRINLDSFKTTKDIENIKISIKGMKQGKDYDVFFKKVKGKVQILIVGKGKFKGTFTKTVKLSK